MIQFWQCCSKNYSGKIKTCRKCGKTQPTYGILDENDQNTAHNEKKSRKTLKKSKDPLISYDEDKLWVSTMKRLGE